MTKTQPVDAFAQARPIDLPFLLLNAVFLAALLVGPQVAPRLFIADLRTPVVVVGIAPYAVTFLVGNVVAEVYGRRRANRVVLAGLFARVCAHAADLLGDKFRTAGNPVVDAHSTVFSMDTWLVWLGPLAAYVAVQYVNVGVFHLVRRATDGRHLWLRNGLATIVAHLVDSALFASALRQGSPDLRAQDLFAEVAELWYVEALLACASTPFCYAAVLLLQRWRARPL